MGLFNMLEMFFFVSLAITFVLILFLVYHFRQKMTSMENRCDAMFDIINNIVKEMNNRTSLVTHHEPPGNIIFKPDMPYFERQELPKLVVSESEYEDDSDDESESESDDDDDADSDESDDDAGADDEADESDDVILPEGVYEDMSVKVINVEIHDIDADITINDENLVANDSFDEEDPDIQDGLDAEKIDNLQVEKLEPTLESNVFELQQTHMDIYRKMNLNALKALVIEKGYASDTNKLKKVELLKLLETSA